MANSPLLGDSNDRETAAVKGTYIFGNGAGGVGVWGVSGPGVIGTGVNGIGVSGTSTNSTAVQGVSQSKVNAGMSGTNLSGRIGVIGFGGPGPAGQFGGLRLRMFPCVGG